MKSGVKSKRTVTKKKATPGPEPERVKLEGNWKENIKTALAKPRQKEGWPKA